MNQFEAILRADKRRVNDIPAETKKRWLDGLEAAVSRDRRDDTPVPADVGEAYLVMRYCLEANDLTRWSTWAGIFDLRVRAFIARGGVSVESVLISIRPDWIQKIFDGEKTVEIRKTFPKLPPPFKCFIYCTKPKYEYDDMILTEPASFIFGGGMVVGEFVCDAAEKLDMDSVGLIIDRTKEYTDWNPCMTMGEMMAYTGGRKPYGWHISDLKVYEKPKPLSDFKRWRGAGKWATLERIKRPPQSWCYVDGGLIG